MTFKGYSGDKMFKKGDILLYGTTKFRVREASETRVKINSLKTGRTILNWHDSDRFIFVKHGVSKDNNRDDD